MLEFFTNTRSRSNKYICLAIIANSIVLVDALLCALCCLSFDMPAFFLRLPFFALYTPAALVNTIQGFVRHIWTMQQRTVSA